MKKRLITTLLAGVMATSMVIPAMADPGGAVPASTGTDVWAGVIIEDMDAKVKVEVPTLFAFVVKGTTTVSDSSPVTSANGDIYLPNVTCRQKEILPLKENCRLQIILHSRMLQTKEKVWQLRSMEISRMKGMTLPENTGRIQPAAIPDWMILRSTI